MILVSPILLILWLLDLTTKSNFSKKKDSLPATIQMTLLSLLGTSAALRIWWIFFDDSSVKKDGWIEFFGHIVPPISSSAPLFLITLFSTWGYFYLARREIEFSLNFRLWPLLNLISAYILTALSIVSIFSSALPTIK